jgi:hypothetical protein
MDSAGRGLYYPSALQNRNHAEDLAVNDPFDGIEHAPQDLLACKRLE